MSRTKRPQVGKSKVTSIQKGYDWGLYFWKLPNGHLFHDGQGNLLNIPSMKHDLSKISELMKTAAHFGQPEGAPWFYPGIKRVTDEEHSEQLDRMKNGLIPNINDMGAVYDAQQTLKRYGDEG